MSKTIVCNQLTIGDNVNGGSGDIAIIGNNGRLITINGIEPTPLIEPEWESLTLSAGLEARAEYGAARIKRIPYGENHYFIEMTGVVQRTGITPFGVNAVTVAVLPTGYRPSATLNFDNAGRSPGVDDLSYIPITGAQIYNNGNIIAPAPTSIFDSRNMFSLNGLCFWVERV